MLAERLLRMHENASAKADQKITVGGQDWVLNEHAVDRLNRVNEPILLCFIAN